LPSFLAKPKFSRMKVKALSQESHKLFAFIGHLLQARAPALRVGTELRQQFLMNAAEAAIAHN
jgi:hypothetical protein